MTEARRPTRKSTARESTARGAKRPPAKPKLSPPISKPTTTDPATPKPTVPEPAPKPTRKPRPKRAAVSPVSPAATDVATPAGAPAPAKPRRIWLSGANGFVGKAVARLLRMRGAEVIAPVRDPRKAGELLDMGATVLEDDLSDVASITEMLRDVDAAIHAAGSYRVGITREERGAMWDANIGTTTRVLDAAEAAKTPRVVYVSTVGVFGNTRGVVVDESYRRNIREGFLSWYDETKFGAHEVVLQRARAGAPIITVQPSQVYGPGDHTAIGEQLAQAHAGKLPYRSLDDVGIGWVHVDDLAVGIVAALDRGAVGRSYVLSGPTHRLREALEISARLGGKKLPRLAVPSRLVRLLAPVGRLIGQPNLREIVSAGAGVTYWASNERAGRELDWHPRNLEDGLRDTFEALADRAYTRS